ncbi:MAG: zinc ribbon domain-containing protein [Woeseia sp.]|nr:zinc ribbon domain-containing protein [Woeseia sp.]MBT8096044.1 zinc ribbon domain-containing protein [Woeseia sp.]NNE59389.1 zinc ribbon domain-containing protein [Woeseia sp.]NNL54463.1 zinc ribbon domain-containing protein [Woeseia sp.]
MPIYEYACNNCKHTLDALQKMSDEPLTECPECGKSQLKRLISAPRFRLKGAGWYETDFKKDNQRNVLKSDSEPAKSDSDAGKKSDKKPDKKVEKKEPSSPTSKTKSKTDS